MPTTVETPLDLLKADVRIRAFFETFMKVRLTIAWKREHRKEDVKLLVIQQNEGKDPADQAPVPEGTDPNIIDSLEGVRESKDMTHQLMIPLIEKFADWSPFTPQLLLPQSQGYLITQMVLYAHEEEFNTYIDDMVEFSKGVV